MRTGCRWLVTDRGFFLGSSGCTVTNFLVEQSTEEYGDSLSFVNDERVVEWIDDVAIASQPSGIIEIASCIWKQLGEW